MTTQNHCHLLNSLLLSNNMSSQTLLPLALELEHRTEAAHVLAYPAHFFHQRRLHLFYILQLFHLNIAHPFEVSLQFFDLFLLGIHVSCIVSILKL